MVYTVMMIVGIDEVGRGCWAGPVVAGAVLLNNHKPITGLNDSKVLSKSKRESLAIEIYKKAQAFGVGWVTAQEVDTIGLTEAVRLAMHRALSLIDTNYDKIVIDGSYNFMVDNPLAETMVKADALVPAVSAASIIAKVARDQYMTKQALAFSEYGFEKHVGYGTLLHRQALAKYGLCELHRKSVKPVAAFLT